jgi:hypothetical protein
MTEHSPPIPDDLPTCQAHLRAVLEQHAALLQRFHDLERQLDETCATTEELQRSYACLKEEYLALKTAAVRAAAGAPARSSWARTSLRCGARGERFPRAHR